MICDKYPNTVKATQQSRPWATGVEGRERHVGPQEASSAHEGHTGGTLVQAAGVLQDCGGSQVRRVFIRRVHQSTI